MVTQSTHKITWAREQTPGMMLGRTGPAHFLIQVSGHVAWNAATTTMVLASTVETQTVKVMPKAAWCTAHVKGPGWPMNMKGQRKQCQGGQQQVAELAVIGSDNGGVVVPDEDAQDAQGKEEEQGCADSQHCAKGLVVGQEVKGLGDALVFLQLGHWSPRHF